MVNASIRVHVLYQSAEMHTPLLIVDNLTFSQRRHILRDREAETQGPREILLRHSVFDLIRGAIQHMS